MVDEADRPIGWIDSNDIRPDSAVTAEMAIPGSPTLQPETTLRDALSAMLLSSVQLGVVVDGRDKVLGAHQRGCHQRRAARAGRGCHRWRWRCGCRQSRGDIGPVREGQPFFRVDWVVENADVLARRIGEQLVITGIAIVVGFVLSFAVALLVRRYPRLYGPVLAVTGLFYSIPSIALFVLLIPITGLSLLTAEIALVGYAMVILVRNIVTALRSVPPEVLEAADGMGYTASQRLWRVEVPIAVPIIVAGLRIATVTIMGLVTIATLIGMGGLGYLIVNIGIKQRFPTATLVGVALVVVLSVIIDAVPALRAAPADAVVGGARGLRRRAVIDFLGEVLAWYTDPAQWTGRNTLPGDDRRPDPAGGGLAGGGDGHRAADRPVHRPYRTRRAGWRWR